MKYFFLLFPFLLLCCSKKNRALLTDQELIEEFRINDEDLKSPEPGEWLYHHPEPGQTMEQYRRIKPVTANKLQHKIYLQPIGDFSDMQDSVIKYTADYLNLFFGLKTDILPGLKDSIIPASARRKRENGSVQLLAPYILDSILKNRIPKDAIVVMAITEKDLYPKPSWGFVFGLATLKDRIGVSSIYRYAKSPVNAQNYSVCLGRLIKVASHEIGHMFSMLHCTAAVCVMNGTNSLSESDARPNRLCSQCLQKLQWNLKFDVRKRLQGLNEFFITHKLHHDKKAMGEDMELIK